MKGLFYLDINLQCSSIFFDLLPACSCYTQNTNGGDVECDDGTGQCDCITGASGQICDACVSGYYIGSNDYCEGKT